MIYLFSLGIAVFGLLVFALKSDRGANSVNARNVSTVKDYSTAEHSITPEPQKHRTKN